MSSRTLSVSLLAVFFLLTACEASFNLSTAALSEAVLALRVDPTTKEPLEKAGTVTPDTQKIFACAKVSHAPGDTKVKAVFFHTKDGTERQIAEDTVTAQGTQYVSFSLSPPANGWPQGDYRVQFYLNDKAKDELHFSVQPAPAATKEQPQAQMPAPATAEKAGLFQRLADERFGFSLEVPTAWSWKVIPGTKDYLISGPAGTESAEISLIVQAVDTRKGGVGSLKEQMLALVDQFAQLQGSAVVKKDVIATAGQQAPFFIVTYLADNTQGQKVEFGHTQLGIDHPPYILLISYSAPREIYQKNLDVFQHVVDSLALRQAN
jgi:hypothetical protein